MSDTLTAARMEIFGRLCTATPAPDILVPLCAAVEQAIPGAIAGVTVLDRSARMFESAVFPSVSTEYGEALRGIQVDDRPGSCALAVYEGRTVETGDIANDDRFAQAWKDLCQAHGMHALVSIPAFHPKGFALGTLVVAFDPARPLTAEQRTLCESARDTVAQVLTYLRRQRRQELLVGELRHRIANVFATIGAMVYSTLRHNPDTAAFRNAFDGRLTALARAHTLALDPGDPDLRTLLSDLLAPYAPDHEIRLNGPSIVLAQDAAFALGMAAHELATNAMKYGSLSASGGAVDIEWKFSGDEEDRFIMTWKERGGPEVQEPKRKGYGDRTIRGTLAAAFDGKVDIDYQPDGLVCQIEAPNSSRLGSRLN